MHIYSLIGVSGEVVTSSAPLLGAACDSISADALADCTGSFWVTFCTCTFRFPVPISAKWHGQGAASGDSLTASTLGLLTCAHGKALACSTITGLGPIHPCGCIRRHDGAPGRHGSDGAGKSAQSGGAHPGKLEWPISRHSCLAP